MVREESGEILEHYLLIHDPKTVKSLNLEAKKRTQQEHVIQRDLIETALKIFDGRKKAIRRSSGGYILAEPFELFAYDCPTDYSNVVPRILIKVKFIDIGNQSTKGQSTPEYLVKSKVVSQYQILETVQWDVNRGQRFVMDFGRGIVPVFVFHYQHCANGTIMAHFFEFSDLEKFLNKRSKPEKITIPLYSIDLRALRFICETGNEKGSNISDYQRAFENYEQLKARRVEIIPKAFMWTDGLSVMSGGTFENFRKILGEKVLDVPGHGVEVAVGVEVAKVAEELKPFGVFESGK